MAQKNPENFSGKKPTLKDVARELNLSVTTISKVINNHIDISDETRRQVLDTIQRMGYIPNFMASNLRRKHGRLVGLVLSDISQPYFSRMIYGCEDVLKHAGYQSLIFNTFEDANQELEILQAVTSLNPAGIIIDISQYPKNSIGYLRSQDIPFVLSNRYIDRDTDCYVVADNEKAGYMATRHLLTKKPGRPVFCLNGPKDISPTNDRMAGYKQALHESKIKVNSKYIFDNNFGLKDGYQAGLAICRNFRAPFSVFCSTDLIALGLMRAVWDSDLQIPEDVSVIGVDDIEVSSYVKPSLTTVTLPKEELGRRSVEMLLSLIDGKEVDNLHLQIEPELTVREST